MAHRAIYAAHSGPISREQRLSVASLSAGNGEAAPLAGATALERHGLRGYPSSRIHVLMPGPRKDTDHPQGVIAHRTSTLSGADIQPSLPPITRVTRSLVDAAAWAASDDDARAIVDAAFQQRLVRKPELLQAVEKMKRAKRRSLVVETAEDAAGGSESISEQDFIRLCRRGGLPEPTRQKLVADADGRRRYRDVEFEDWKIVVEIDGSQHIQVKSWWNDMARQNRMWTEGFRLLRFPAWVVRKHPDEVLRQLRAALTEAGWRP